MQALNFFTRVSTHQPDEVPATPGRRAPPQPQDLFPLLCRHLGWEATLALSLTCKTIHQAMSHNPEVGPCFQRLLFPDGCFPFAPKTIPQLFLVRRDQKMHSIGD